MKQCIPSTPFIPFSFPDGKNMTLLQIKNILGQNSAAKPTVIFISRHTIEFPLDCPVNQKIIYLPQNRIPDGCEFSIFKSFVFEELKVGNQPIGVCTTKLNDLCAYIIVRWMIEEASLTYNQSINLIKGYFPSGINKKKYLDSLSEIYGFERKLEPLSVNKNEDESQRLEYDDGNNKKLFKVDLMKNLSVLNDYARDMVIQNYDDVRL